MTEQRYTLSLPTEIYNELRAQAEKHNRSIKEIVSQCLKFGLVAIKLDEDPNTDLYLKERIPQTDGKGVITSETRLKFIW
jgi:hypothetical protein